MSNAQDKKQDILRELEIAEVSANYLKQSLDLLNTMIGDLLLSKDTLNELKTKKPGDELLVPIGGSAFIRAKIEDVNSTIVGIGSGVFLARKIDDAINVIDNLLKKYNDQKTNVSNQLAQIYARIQVLQSKVATK